MGGSATCLRIRPSKLWRLSEGPELGKSRPFSYEAKICNYSDRVFKNCYTDLFSLLRDSEVAHRPLEASTGVSPVIGGRLCTHGEERAGVTNSSHLRLWPFGKQSPPPVEAADWQRVLFLFSRWCISVCKVGYSRPPPEELPTYTSFMNLECVHKCDPQQGKRRIFGSDCFEWPSWGEGYRFSGGWGSCRSDGQP